MSSAEFAIPPHYQDLEDPNSGYYLVTDDENIAASSSDVIVGRLDELEGQVMSDAWVLASPEVFDPLYSLVLRMGALDPEIKARLVQIIVDGTQKFAATWRAAALAHLSQTAADEPKTEPGTDAGADAEAEIAHSAGGHTAFCVESRSVLKQYVFLLHMVVMVVEKEAGASPAFTSGRSKKKSKKAQKAFVWKEVAGFIVAAFTSVVVDVEPEFYRRLWSMPQPEEEFLSAISRALFTLYESQATLKSLSGACMESIHAVFKGLVVGFGCADAISTSIMHMLHGHEHLTSPLAALLAAVAEINEETQEPHPAARHLIEDVLQEIGKTSSAQLARDTAGTKNLAAFVTAVATNAPKVALGSVSVLIHHLDGDAYVMRNAIIEMMGACLMGPLKGSDASAKDTFLDVLMERVYDVTSYTRSRTLQTWSNIVQAHALPLANLLPLVKVTVGRLRDKASVVRRSALQLLKEILQNNPFSSGLRLGVFEAKLETLSARKAELEALVRPGGGAEPAVQRPENDSEEAMAAAIAAAVQAAEVAAQEQAARDEDASLDGARAELEALEKELAFVQSGTSFIRSVSKAIPLVAQLLTSKTVMDVLQAIEFITVTSSFGIQESTKAVRRILTLIWSKEESVREAVKDSYRSMYFAPGTKTLAACATVARNLMDITLDATVAELVSLEELIAHMRRDDSLPLQVDAVLWELFTESIEGVTQAQSLAALQILCMISKADPKAIACKLDTLVKHGLGERARANPIIARWTCETLHALASVDKDAKIPTGHGLLKQLERLIVDSPYDPAMNGQWYPAAEQAIAAIFALAAYPELEVELIVRVLAHAVFGDGVGVVDSERAARLFFVVGHTGLKSLVWMENLGRANSTDKLLREQEAAKAAAQGSDEEEEDDLALAAGNSLVDEQAEFLANVAERCLVMDNLLGSFGPLLAHICMYRGKYENEAVQTHALLALTKFMCVSREFCNEHLRLVFSIVNQEETVTSSVRANLMIAIGDLAFRFPNEVEPWTEHIYGRLRDADITVRQNTLMVLTHLILNDMIKVKGQIAEIGICLLDKEKAISDLAYTFFKELGRKANTIFNILPDTISMLSTDEANARIGAGGFKTIMSYLFSFVEKEKQQEALVVKLCHRLQASTTQRDSRNFAHCLSLLSYSARSLTRLMENYKAYHDKVFDGEIEASFRLISSRTKRNAKDVVLRFDALIDALLNGETEVEPLITGMSSEALLELEAANKAKAAAKKKARADTRKKKAAAAKKKKARGADSDDDDFAMEGVDAVVPKDRPQRRSRRTVLQETN